MARSSKDIQKRAKELARLIEYHQKLYHEHDMPEIADEAYDSLVRELGSIEAKYPELRNDTTPTERIGGEVNEAFSKVTHRARQWSFDNVFNDTELREWEARLYRYLEKQNVTVGTVAYVGEHKIDGLKVICEYEEGVLVRAATRGNGTIGEDITHSARMIQDIPKELSHAVNIVVIGECWLGHDEFERINRERKESEEPLFANPRNAAAGSLRQLDPNITKSRKLSYFAYDIDIFESLDSKLKEPVTQWEELTLLKKLGFNVNPHSQLCTDLDELLTYYHEWVPKKHAFPYGMDGVVVKVNEVTLQKVLGYTAKSPRFGIAYKFPSEQATTVLEHIELQVGRTGVLTPVAHLRPVLIAGSTVSRATLHNEDQIKRLDIREGDTVVLQKAGDVIPEIISVVLPLRPKKARPYAFPTHVAECGGDGSIERIPGQAAYRCVAKDSEALHLRRLYYFVSKAGFDIDGVGPRIIDTLLEYNLISTYVDLFTLTTGDIEGLPGFKERSADNIVNAINVAKNVPLHRLLVSLSIDHVGEETARLIANRFCSIDDICTATTEELAAIHGVGEVVAGSLVTWLSQKAHRNVLNELLKHVTIIAPETKRSAGVLQGKTVVFTGTLPTLSRGDGEELARQHGAHVAGSVSRKTDYVVLGTDAGSKEDKARELGVPLLSEAEFLKLIGEA